MKSYIPLALAAALTLSPFTNAQTQFGLLVQHAAIPNGDHTLSNTQTDPTPSGQVSEMHWLTADYLRAQSSTIFGDASHNATSNFTGNPVFSLFGTPETSNQLVMTIVNRPPAPPACTAPCTKPPHPAYYPDGSTLTYRQDGTFTVNSMATYTQHVTDILDYHVSQSPHRLPRIIQIENEPLAKNFYAGAYTGGDVSDYEADTARMDHYIDELKNAIIAIRAKYPKASHPNLKITDGGTTSDPLCIMTWDAIYRNKLSFHGAQGQAAADSFGNLVLHHGENGYPNVVSWLPYMSYDFYNPSDPKGPPAGLSAGDQTMYANMLQAWKNGKRLLKAYATNPDVADLDYINIHFYKKVDTTSAANFADAFGTVIDFLRSDKGVPGKTIISTEMGQYDQNPAVVTNMIAKIQDINTTYGQLPVVIWYDADGYNRGDGTNGTTVPPYGLHWGKDDHTDSDPKGIGCLNDSGRNFYKAFNNNNLPSRCETDRAK